MYASTKQGRWVTMTLDTSALKHFAQDFSLMIIVRVADNSIETLTDTGIAKSALFTITGEIRTVQVNMSEDFIARSDAVSRNHNEMSLQFFIVLIPQRIRAEQILTINDVTAVGGQQLQSSPSPEVKMPTPFK
jgi:hypothetical protein